jgi:glycosyltransferase involved in cell wall biosynthesis
MSSGPRVSIVTPCYNGERYIAACIQSVQHQIFTSWEHIIVDDGSVDRSATIARQWAHADTRIRCLVQSNSGVSSARNRGAEASDPCSEYILFLDVDDCLEPAMLERMVRYLDQHPGVAMAHCRYTAIDADGVVLPINTEHHFNRYARGRQGVYILPADVADTPLASIFSIVWTVIIPSVAVIRRRVYAATPGWDVSLDQTEDTDLFIHIALRGDVHFVNEDLVRYRYHSEQVSANKLRQKQQRARLYQKWVGATWLTEQQRLIIDDAWQFRQGKLLPYFWRQSAGGHFRCGNRVEAAKCIGRSLRQLIYYWIRRAPGSYYS